MERRIVCAAIRHETTKDIILGIRHFDKFMVSQIKQRHVLKESWITAEQGFVDQYGNFLTRAESFGIAIENGQRIRRCGGDDGVLYSENLY